jgi:membrane associated rhomboid family serine protease
MLLACLYAAAVWAAYLAGVLPGLAEGDRRPAFDWRPVPRATIVLTVLVAASAVLQLLFPALLTTFERNGPRVLHGEWWRLVTSLFVQDGGVSGTAFNLASLLLVGALAERRWGSRRWVAIFAMSAIAGGVAGLAWQPVGAGTSIAIFGLAGSIAVAALRDRPGRAALVLAGVAAAAGVLLLLLKDIHGAAAVTGMILALLIGRAGNWKLGATTTPASRVRPTRRARSR